MHLVRGESDAVVGEDEGRGRASGTTRDLHLDLAGRRRRIHRPARPDSIAGVLEELADLDVRRAVEVVREEVDDTTQVNLEPVFCTLRHLLSRC